jgi:carbon storage regulator
MLVLSRKKQESIIIGNNIRVTVIEVGPNKVRLGIEAPKDVRVDREEVRAAIQGKGEKKNKPEAA